MLLDIKANKLTLLNKLEHGAQPEFSPDGKRIAWVSGDFGNDKELKVYDRIQKNTQSYLIQNDDFINSVTWAPDGKTLIYSSSEEICFYSLAEEEVVKSIPVSNPSQITISPDGTYLLYSEIGYQPEENRWTLHRYNLNDGTSIENSDMDHGHVVGAQLFWVADSSRFFTWRYEQKGEDHMSHDISHHFLWFDKDLKPIGPPTENPKVIQRSLFPSENELDIWFFVDFCGMSTFDDLQNWFSPLHDIGDG